MIEAIHNEHNLFSLKAFLPPEAPNSCNVSSRAGYLSFLSQHTACPYSLSSVLLGWEAYKLHFPDTLTIWLLVMFCQVEELLEIRRWKKDRSSVFSLLLISTGFLVAEELQPLEPQDGQPLIHGSCYS